MYQRNYNIQKFLDQRLRTSLNYAYSLQPKYLEPLKNWGPISNKDYLLFLRELNINLIPSSIAVNSNIIRSYNEQLSRSLVEGLPDLPTLTQRNFMFNWDYLIAYNLTKSIQLTFRALDSYVYDDFEGENNIQLYDNFFTFGRPEHYHQTLEASYKLPFDKFKHLEFINGTYNYTADYDWQAPSLSNIPLIGNNIQNANTHTFTADLSMDRLYQDLKLDRLFNKKTVQKVDKNGIALPPNSGKPQKLTNTGQQMGRFAVDVLT